MAKKNKNKETKFTNSAFEQLKHLAPKMSAENKKTTAPVLPIAPKVQSMEESVASHMSIEEEKAIFLAMMRNLSHRDSDGGKFSRKEKTSERTDMRQLSSVERDEDIFSREMAIAQVDKINTKNPKIQFAKKKKNTLARPAETPQQIETSHEEHSETKLAVDMRDEQHETWFSAEVHEKTGIRPLQSKLQKQLNKLSAPPKNAENVEIPKNEEKITPPNLFNLAPYKELLKKINKHIDLFGPLPELNLKGLILHAALRRLEIFIEAMHETRTPYALVLLSSPLSADEKAKIVQTVKKNNDIKDVVPILESASDFESVYISVRL